MSALYESLRTRAAALRSTRNPYFTRVHVDGAGYVGSVFQLRPQHWVGVLIGEGPVAPRTTGRFKSRRAAKRGLARKHGQKR